MATYLITGSSRGLGLELVTQLAALPSAQVGRIFATTRSEPSAALTNLVDGSSGRVVRVELDTCDKTSVTNASTEVAKILHADDTGLDVLINNAGTMPVTPDGIETM